MILEYVLLAVLLLSAVFIIVAVIFQKSSDEGLSGTISGGSETYYGKDKSVQTGKKLFKISLETGDLVAGVLRKPVGGADGDRFREDYRTEIGDALCVVDAVDCFRQHSRLTLAHAAFRQLREIVAHRPPVGGHLLLGAGDFILGDVGLLHLSAQGKF